MVQALSDDNLVLMQDMLNLTDEIECKVKSVVSESESSYFDFTRYVALFRKSINTFRAYCILIKAGYINEAAILNRTNFESLVELLYFRKSDNNQCYDFWRAKGVRELRDLELYGLNDPGREEEIGELLESQKEFCKNYNIKGNFPHHWSGKKIRERAEDVGWEQYYKTIYHMESDIVHSGLDCITGYIGIIDDCVSYKDNIPNRYTNHIAYIIQLGVYYEINDLLGLGLGDSIDKISRPINDGKILVQSANEDC